MLASATNGPGTRKPLRELAAARGIRIGTALDPALVDSDSSYGALVTTQFDSVTPEKAMKWKHLICDRQSRAEVDAIMVANPAQAEDEVVD